MIYRVWIETENGEESLEHMGTDPVLAYETGDALRMAGYSVRVVGSDS